MIQVKENREHTEERNMSPTNIHASSSRDTSSSLVSSSLKIEYDNHVLVYGFDSSSIEQYEMVHSRFRSNGTILSRYPTIASSTNNSNWVCFEYKSRIEAEKALCQHGTFLDATDSSNITIIGVMRVNAVIAQKLALKGSFGGANSVTRRAQDNENENSRRSRMDENVSVDQTTKNDVYTPSPKKKALLSEDDILLFNSSPQGTITCDNENIGIRGTFVLMILTWIFQW